MERRLEVESTKSPPGSWYWFNSKEVHYRPREYWKPGERVTLNIRLAGVNAGDGIWGTAESNRSISFKIGPSHISIVDARTHTMRVTENGRTIRTFPVSTGRDEYPTTNGIHFVLEKNHPKIMDSSTIGIPRNSPQGYYLKVDYSVRISNSGEFVHSAPWSVGAQGQANVSHGCVNMAPKDAAWFYHFTRRGDVVHVINSKRPPTMSLGVADWNIPWSRWKAGSAL